MQGSAEVETVQLTEQTEAEITDDVVDALAQVRLQSTGVQKKALRVEIVVFRRRRIRVTQKRRREAGD